MSGTRIATKAWTRAQARVGRKQALPVVLIGLLGAAVAIMQAACVALILAAALCGTGGGQMGWLLGGFAVAACLRGGLLILSEIVAAKAGARARARLRRGALLGLLSDGPRMLRRTHSAAIAAVLVDRIEAVDGFFARYLPAASLALAAPLLVLAVACFVQPFAALALLCGGIAVPVMQAMFGIGAAVAARSQFQAMSRLQTRFVDRVRGIATIVLAGRAEDEARRLSLAADELRLRTMRVLRVAFLSSAGLDCAMATSLVAIALHDGALFLQSTHPAASFGAPPPAISHALFGLLLVPEFFAPLRNFALAYQDRAQAASCAESMAEFPQAAAPEPDAGTAPSALQAVSLVFEDVSFAWDASRGAALDGLSFRLAPGEMLLLCGPSGSGKSTVIEMLLGFIRPDRGRVLIDGVDLHGLAAAALSSLISWIGQKPVLFAGSLRENILFARPEADAKAMAEAISIAALDRVVAELPDGLDTQVGEGGYGLSGGQAQRVAIARAVLRQAPLVLLDEPTAHLDPDTEDAIFDSLRRLARHRTVVLASHSAAALSLGGRRLEILDGRLAPERGAA